MQFYFIFGVTETCHFLLICCTWWFDGLYDCFTRLFCLSSFYFSFCYFSFFDVVL